MYEILFALKKQTSRWTGRLLAPKSGKYTFSAKVDDGIRVWVGGTKVIDAWALHDSENFSGSITLEANKHYNLKVEYFNGIFEGEIQLLWVPPGEGNALTDLFSSSAKPVDAKYFSQPVTSKPANPVPKPSGTKPVYVNPATEKDRALNRRVEIRVK